jgi:uncharacterized cupin superfamily protein
MDAGAAVVAASLSLTDDPVADDQVRAGAPRTGFVDLDETGERTVGVWEHTPGVSTDIESDEVFVVVAGSGTLEFTDPELPPVELRPGVIVRLTQGMHTMWAIRETLRKVYIA